MRNNTEIQQKHPSHNYCTDTYRVSGAEVVNLYKCAQKQLTVADAWNIDKKRKRFVVGTIMNVA